MDHTVVAEVLNDGQVIVYDKDVYELDDAAQFLSYYDPTESRNFFLATFTLIPLQELPPS